MKKLRYLLLAVLFITLIPAAGCKGGITIGGETIELPELPEKVVVLVDVWAQVVGTDYRASGQSFENLYEGVDVEFKISNLGGKPVTKYLATNADALTEPLGYYTALYEDQIITVTATTMGTGSPVSKTITLSFDDIEDYNVKDDGTMEYTWNEQIDLRVPPPDPDLYPAETVEP